MNCGEINLLSLYRLVVLGAAAAAFGVGLFRARKWIVRYNRLPASFQQAVRRGIYAAAMRFLARYWLGLMALILLLIVLAGLSLLPAVQSNCEFPRQHWLPWPRQK